MTALSRSNRRLRNKAIAQAAKDVPCADCGKRFPAVVMDFDHRDPNKKRYPAKGMAVLFSAGETALRAEIAKCDVVCSNCHRIRTWTEKPNGWNHGRAKGATRREPYRPKLIRTHCSHGHPFDEANSYRDRRHVLHCRACARATSRKVRARRRVGGPPKYYHPPRPRVTHCKRGHPYDAINTYVNSAGDRICRACARRYQAQRRARVAA